MIKSKIYSLLIVFSLLVILLIAGLLVFIKMPMLLNFHPVILVLSSILFSLLFLSLYLMIEAKGFKLSNLQFFAFLTVLVVLVRLLWVLSVDTAPVSDFLHFHNYGTNASQGEFTSFIKFYSFYSFKFGYGFVIAGIYKLFGTSILAVKLFNVLLSICLCFLVYWIGKMVFGEKPGRIASVLCALWPAQIMYSSVMASEHLFIVFFMLGTGLFIKYRDYTKGLTGLLWLIVSGVSLTLAQIVRPLSTMLIPIFIVYLVLFVKNTPTITSGLFKKTKVTTIIVLSFAISLTLINIPFEKLTGIPIWRSSPSVNLLIGTNYKYLGIHNKEDFSILEEYNYDYDKVSQEATKRSIERIKANPLGFIKLAARKMIIQWSDENYGYYWSTQKFQQDTAAGNFVKNNPGKFAAAAQYFYFFILLLTAAGCLFLFKKRIFEASIFLFIFGGILVSYTFFEVQPRYHFPVIPFFLMIAGFGLSNLGSLIFSRFKTDEA